MDATDPLLERLWAANRRRTLARFLDVLAVLDALASGRAADVPLGISQAHALAGSLGTYRRDGSALMRTVEEALHQQLSAEAAAELATRVRRLLAALDVD